MVLTHIFGPVDSWPDQDLIGFSEKFDAEFALAGYYSGVFPMPLHESCFSGEMGWWSPVRRGIVELDDLRVTRSLRKSAKHFLTSIDCAFDEVLARCADTSRPYGWIDEQVRDVYRRLQRAGRVHSVETWDEQHRLVGGLYGVSLGGLFAGESMFHDDQLGRDASKVALIRLVEELRVRPDGTALLDVQWLTDHLASVGGSEISREDYLQRLSVALDAPDTDWPQPEASTRRVHA